MSVNTEMKKKNAKIVKKVHLFDDNRGTQVTNCIFSLDPRTEKMFFVTLISDIEPSGHLSLSADS